MSCNQNCRQGRDCNCGTTQVTVPIGFIVVVILCILVALWRVL